MSYVLFHIHGFKYEFIACSIATNSEVRDLEGWKPFCEIDSSDLCPASPWLVPSFPSDGDMGSLWDSYRVDHCIRLQMPTVKLLAL